MLNLKILNIAKYAVIFGYLYKIEQDYAWGMAKNFQNAVKNKVWNKSKLAVNSFLTNGSKLAVLLNELEKYQLIYSYIRKMNKGQDRKYYKINYDVFINDFLLTTHKFVFPKVIDGKIVDQEYSVSSDQFKEIFDYHYKMSSGYYWTIDLHGTNTQNIFEIIADMNRWEKFDFYTIISMIIFGLEKFRINFIKIMNDIDSSSNERGYVIKRVVELNYLMNYFLVYQDLINLSYYRKDFQQLIDQDLLPKREGLGDVFKRLDLYLI